MGLFFDYLRGFPAPIKILDVGGTFEFWARNPPPPEYQCQITLLNPFPVYDVAVANVQLVKGDARNMVEFADQSFDVCFSNSVIEHVGTLYDQMAMAKEVKRVCRGYFIQTPYRFFPFEPHFFFPLWQFLPIPLRAFIFHHRSMGFMPHHEEYWLNRAEVEQIRLLDRTQLRYLFPEATMRFEKLGPLIKSIILTLPRAA